VVKGGVETDGVTAVGHLSPVPRETEVPLSYNVRSDDLVAIGGDVDWCML